MFAAAPAAAFILLYSVVLMMVVGGAVAGAILVGRGMDARRALRDVHKHIA